MKSGLSLESIVVVNSVTVSTDLDGEIIILEMNKGMYFGLDAVGAEVWKLLQQPRRLREVHDAILRDYDVAPDVCERDLLSLLDDLARSGLVEVVE